MKPTKVKVMAVLIAGLFAVISIQMAAPPPPPSSPPYDQSAYERFPPVPTQFWVQKLATPLVDGSNVILRIKYIYDHPLPPIITLYVSGATLSFHDDGTGPDATSGDGIYAAYVAEDIPQFLTQVAAYQANLSAMGTFTTFTGHFAQENTTITPFDTTGFASNQQVPIEAMLINGVDCAMSGGLLPQNSLFITDLSVVEDSARTYNVADNVGNPNGVWTFGNLVKNIVNSTHAGDARAFLKNWVNSYYTGRTINGQAVAARTAVVDFLIAPWLRKANNNPSLSINSNTWQSVWDQTDETQLLQNAPFKLLAIVNRMDLAGNSYYSSNGSLLLAGETRFIYTLIAPIDYTIGTVVIHKGQVPVSPENSTSEHPELIDWKGMNVIFEYGNPQTTSCDLLHYAQQWGDLSNITLGSANYNDSLEAITHTVIDTNVVPSKVNGSALDRMRSNERIFFPEHTSSFIDPIWEQSDWQLSQFELDASTHQLKPAPVANTPQIDGNTFTNMNVVNPTATNPSATSALIDWVYANQVAVSQGNHQMPFTYTTTANGNTFSLAGAADMHYEQGHFWDMNWDAADAPNYTTILPGATNVQARALREQLSINTCQGCHGGENKTLFTQVRPVGYGVSEDYWNTIPASETGPVDLRFVQNAGTSFQNSVVANVYDLISNPPGDYGAITTPITVPYISSFLTGRAYHGGGDFSDDNNAASDNINDPTFGQGSYYVYDPADLNDGTTDNTRPNPDKLSGFNDLLMRKNRLCIGLTFFCIGTKGATSRIITSLAAAQQIPLAE